MRGEWGAVDAMLFIRTPEEEASGQWAPPTAGEIQTNRARWLAWQRYKDDLPRDFRDAVTAFNYGFAAGIAHASTTADPARLARLESLLREIEWMGHSFDVGQHYLHCLICQGIKGVTGHSPHCTLAALLGPAE